MSLSRMFLRCFVCIALAVSAVGAMANPTLDCDKIRDDQARLQKAIDQAKPGDVVSVAGTCNGISLVIAESGITLQGPANLVGTTAAPVVRVQDSGNVSLQDLVVSNGTRGIELANSRVTASNVEANNNLDDGFISNQNSDLVCFDCKANNNADIGLIAAANVTLCGNSEFRDNVNTGVLVFLGGRVFSSTGVCGARPAIAMSGNPSGMTLFQNGGVFLDEVDLDASGLATGIGVFDSSALTVRRSHIVLDGSGFAGLNIGAGSIVRLNDDAPSTAGGSTTSIQGNGSFGVLLDQNSQVVLGNATVTGNPTVDLSVQNFSVANAFGVSTTGTIFCEPAKSSGNLCP